jgi:hypothetical protein
VEIQLNFGSSIKNRKLAIGNVDAVRSNFGFEILQSSNLAVVAAVLPFYSDLFRIRA